MTGVKNDKKKSSKNDIKWQKITPTCEKRHICVKSDKKWQKMSKSAKNYIKCKKMTPMCEKWQKWHKISKMS